MGVPPSLAATRPLVAVIEAEAQELRISLFEPFVIQTNVDNGCIILKTIPPLGI